MNLRALLPFSFSFIVLAAGAAAQSGPHVIKGTVFVPGNRPAVRAEVVLENSSGVQLSRVFADQDGRYTFPGLRFGAYRVVALVLGQDYDPSSQDVEISGSNASIIIRTVDLYLKPKAGTGAKGLPRTVSAFSQQVPADAEEEYKKGSELLESGAGDKAAEHLKRAIEIFPDYFLALLRLGAEYARTGGYDLAVPLLIRACEINSGSTISQVTLGMSLVELGRFEEAIVPLERGRTLDARSISAHLYLGIAQSQTGRLREAEGNLKQAHALGGAERAAVARLYLASIYDRQGKYGQAADELEVYLKEVPRAKNRDKIREAASRMREKQKKG